MRLGFAIALAACGDGVFIEVDTSEVPGVDQVEIITAKKRCHLPFQPEQECDHMQGVGFDDFETRGDIFFRNATTLAPLDPDGIAAFQLEPGQGVLPMAFAIGRDAQGTPIGVAVMEGTLDTDAGTRVYRVTLDPAQDFVGTDRDDTLAAFTEWGVDAKRDCMAIAPLQPDPLRGLVYIVPASNPDCDLATDAAECDPLWFDGFAIDEVRSNRHCVIETSRIDPHPGSSTPPCVLGHLPACSENPQREEPCVEQRDAPPLCLPGVLCEPDNALCSDPHDEACLQTALLGDGKAQITPVVLCDVPGQDSAGGLVPCATSPQMALARPLDFLSEVTCQNVLLTGSTPPFHAPRTDTVTDATTTIKVELFSDDCNIVFTWAGSGAPNQSLKTTLVLTLDTGDETREMMVPIKFTLRNSCTGMPGACVLLPQVPATNGDSIFGCAF